MDAQNDLSDFDYELPPTLIAQKPVSKRTDSRLMVVDGDVEQDWFFRDFIKLIEPTDVLVVNDTKVVKARLHGLKDTGGAVEILVERIDEPTIAYCHVRASKPLKVGRLVHIDDQNLEVLSRGDELSRILFPIDVLDFLERYGHVPLPPYIGRAAEPDDEQRYQTVYRRVPGAVAAPTAGLHFDDALLEAIRMRGTKIVPVTLHVGAGTFQPVRVEDANQHFMHAERYRIPPSSRREIDHCQGRVIAVGTTVVRALESAARTGNDCGETRLFIRPGFRFDCVDALITNFHLPRSTLLMLVSAFIGNARMRQVYAAAVERGYRFYSYGDAMFCERADV
ncbi:MAG: tRNA preQ1(34) S-adenosylmethionine ribosyltransferase-isomerase QueA [Pseudomonadota bacterium]|nr:tRNA preQ1(34) S-adenosylmethionine ribosyltransferase-isomerase QueA [Pseudomonadota bacterium]